MAISRQKILNHLKKNRFASAREIARALRLSAPNVRHHLSVLSSDGRVEVIAVRGVESRGRPEKLYSLSQASRGDNLSLLVQTLLTSPPDPNQTGAEMARRLGMTDLPSTAILAKRLTLLVERLNESHYQAHWEAGAQGPRLLFGRCPYARVIEGRAEICKMDASMLKTALGRSVDAAPRSERAIQQDACPFLFQIK